MDMLIYINKENSAVKNMLLKINDIENKYQNIYLLYAMHALLIKPDIIKHLDYMGDIKLVIR